MIESKEWLLKRLDTKFSRGTRFDVYDGFANWQSGNAQVKGAKRTEAIRAVRSCASPVVFVHLGQCVMAL